MFQYQVMHIKIKSCIKAVNKNDRAELRRSTSVHHAITV